METTAWNGIDRRSDAKEVTHQEIYDRLAIVETKVDRIDEGTKDIISAFASARGAFTVLEFIGKLIKPIIWVTGIASAIAIIWTEHFKR